MAAYGNGCVFDEKVESFEDYRDRVDCFMSTSPIDQAFILFLVIVSSLSFRCLVSKVTPQARPTAYLMMLAASRAMGVSC